MTKLKADIVILKAHESLLDLLHICSPSYPTGGFNHSFGLETFIEEKVVHNKDTLLMVLKSYIDFQYTYSEGFAIRKIYEILDNYKQSGDEKLLDEIWYIDELLAAQCLAHETHQGVVKIATRSIETLVSIYPNKILELYKDKIANKKCQGNSVIPYSIVFYQLEVGLKEAIEAYTFNNMSTLVQNAVRAIPLGPSDSILVHKEMSKSIKKLYSKIMKLDEEEFGINSMGLELSQMRHEVTVGRLFMS